MDSGGQLLLLVRILFLASVLKASIACPVHRCYAEYTNLASGYNRLQQRSSILRSLNSRQTAVKEYCQSLEAYSNCMKKLDKSCRGKLDYHAVITHVKKWIDDYNCTGSQKIRSPGKNSLNLTLRQQSEAARDYPWTGSSSISNPPVKRKGKRCKKHRTHPQQRNLGDSLAAASADATAPFSSSTTCIHSTPVLYSYALTTFVITLISATLTFT